MTSSDTLRRVLIANRGEIAVRVARACFDEGIESVAAVSAADVDSMAARVADQSICIGPASAALSYLHIPAVIAAAIATGCDSIHPGYGFLSERPELAEACVEHGLVFVGPPADVIRRGGNKVAAREAARNIGLPVGMGSDHVSDWSAALEVADRVGYPVLLKAAAGGGGRGMVRVDRGEDLCTAFENASREAQAAFGDGSLFVERYVGNARHVEVQILADMFGTVVHLGERDCSSQRRYQKLVEEAPSAGLPDFLRQSICESAVRLAEALGYVGAGTVEFLVDVDREEYFFLEVNTRVQVEHPVTEMITGIDIVREQLRIAAGRPLSFAQSDVQISGHAIECRLNAEDPRRGFLPSPGRIDTWTMPAGEGIRVDTHCHDGYVISANYDSMVAKLICWAKDRPAAIELMAKALRNVKISGVDTTAELQLAIVQHGDFRADNVNTRWIEERFLPAWESVGALV